MKPFHSSLFCGFVALALSLTSFPSLAEDNHELVIDNPPPVCQPLVSGPDLAETLALCTRQARLGRADAQFILGNYWYEGSLIEADYNQALHWFEQASLQGHAEAQYRLGLMFAEGHGVAVSRPQAYVILKMSAINGSDQAYDASDRLDAQMSHEELQQANEVLTHIFRRYLKRIQEQGAGDDAAGQLLD